MPARRFALALALGGALSLSACKEKEAKAPPPPPAVTVAKPLRRAVQAWVHATGNAAALDRVELRAQVTGFLIEKTFTDGQLVAAGEKLFVIDPRPYAIRRDRAKAHLEQSEVARKEAAVRLERLEAALKQKAVPELDVIQQRATVDKLAAQVDGAKADLAAAELDLEFTRINAPLGGRISRALPSLGDLVLPNTDTLASIVSVDPIYVFFTVTERDLQEVRKKWPRPQGKDAPPIPIEVGLSTDAGWPHQGVIDYADPSVDPDTGTITLRARLDNKAEVLRDGYFCRVRIPVGEPAERLLVADRAVGTDQGQKYLLTVDAQGKASYAAVTLGPLEEGLRVIEAGLTEDAQVIVDGLQRVRPGVTVTAKLMDMPVSKVRAPEGVAAPGSATPPSPGPTAPESTTPDTGKGH